MAKKIFKKEFAPKIIHMSDKNFLQKYFAPKTFWLKKRFVMKKKNHF